MIKLAHARQSEDGNIRGKAGDQTGHEVEVSDFYEGWEKLFRFKDREDANKAAKFMVAVCNNDNAGYSQYSRLSLLRELENCNWVVSKIGPCNCDCSSLIMTTCRYLGYDVPENMWTGNQFQCLMSTGKFSCLTEFDNLQNGDILWKTGHTAMAIVDNPDCDFIATGNVFIREEPVDGKTLSVIPKGAAAEKLSNPWVKVKYNGIEGWCSTKYLEPGGIK